ncbi:endo-beta-N-acetylglucosaminidase [Streptomyces sp. NPDC060184]|uniref:endo-beta-N-acetylglucosaminidase n=1 Tax=Streptomyces sp. NPDC060184 TaxID=3347064 RepID=UPI00364B87D7
MAPAFAPTASAAPAAEADAGARAGAGAGGLQPYASYWFPDSLPAGTPGDGITWRSLKSWRPEDDRDLPFNTATVPLAGRFTPVPANTTARTGQARITSLVAFDHTAGNPSQGSATADHYALTQWAYIDELVFWGGSAGEGLILAPNAPVVDAAHRNGVPVLGTVFLPPVHHGGDLRWTRDLVRRDAAGHFPLAAKLVEVATAHGFDGWFLNAETEGGDAALGADMLAFVTELRARGEAAGLRTTWYDAMTADGQVGWQGALNDENTALFREADSMFVDFRWTPDTLAASGERAESVGRSRYDLWAGVDVESTGWNREVDWDAIVPTDRPHTVSYGFYRPEWTLNSLPADRTPGQFHVTDQRFWTGDSLDPSRPGPPSAWRAPAVVVADRSTVDRLPFATTFNTGHGLRWYENGRPVSDTPWNHLGLQDRLPGRRWVVRTEGAAPSVAFDFADAWRGGSSLLVDGAIEDPATVDLFETRLPLTPHTVVELTHRLDPDSGPVTVELAVALREPDRPGAPPAYTHLPAGELRPGAAGWTTATLRLGRLRGTVHALGIRLTGAGAGAGASPGAGTGTGSGSGTRSGTGAVRWRLGALAVRDGAATPHPPTALRVTDTAATADGTALRLRWHRAPGPVRHYEIHRELPDKTRRFLGGTCQTAFFLPGIRREPGENSARLVVTAVDELYTPSGAAVVAHRW